MKQLALVVAAAGLVALGASSSSAQPCGDQLTGQQPAWHQLDAGPSLNVTFTQGWFQREVVSLGRHKCYKRCKKRCKRKYKRCKRSYAKKYCKRKKRKCKKKCHYRCGY